MWRIRQTLPLKAGSTSKATAKRELMAKGDKAFDAEDFEKALDYYHRVTVLDGQDSTAWNALGMTYYNLDFPREAWRSYKLSLQVDPENLETLWYAAEFLYNMEDFLLAKAFLNRYIEREIDPDRLGAAKSLLVDAEHGIETTRTNPRTKTKTRTKNSGRLCLRR